VIKAILNLCPKCGNMKGNHISYLEPACWAICGACPNEWLLDYVDTLFIKGEQ
jgi:hypothetical protein